jgi:hypothetical protein
MDKKRLERHIPGGAISPGPRSSHRAD